MGGSTKRSQLPRIKESKLHSASGVAFVVFRQVELDSLAWSQLGQAAVLHRSEVDEDVLASVDGNESLSLLPAELLHRSDHDHAPCEPGLVAVHS